MNDDTGATQARRYYRSIVRWEQGAAYIKLPSDDSVHPGVVYEIRDTDKHTVLGHATGQQLIAARNEQLAAYLAADPERTNIAMVDVSSFLPPRS